MNALTTLALARIKHKGLQINNQTLIVSIKGNNKCGTPSLKGWTALALEGIKHEHFLHGFFQKLDAIHGPILIQILNSNVSRQIHHLVFFFSVREREAVEHFVGTGGILA
ncbi:hypothetical protein ACJX0J_017462 [Zea mays]